MKDEELILVQIPNGDWAVAEYIESIDAFQCITKPFGSFTEARDKLKSLEGEWPAIRR